MVEQRAGKKAAVEVAMIEVAKSIGLQIIGKEPWQGAVESIVKFTFKLVPALMITLQGRSSWHDDQRGKRRVTKHVPPTLGFLTNQPACP